MGPFPTASENKAFSAILMSCLDFSLVDVIATDRDGASRAGGLVFEVVSSVCMAVMSLDGLAF